MERVQIETNVDQIKKIRRKPAPPAGSLFSRCRSMPFVHRSLQASAVIGSERTRAPEH